MTVEQWLNTWLDEYCKDVKMRTMDKYRSTVRLHLIPALGKVKLFALNSRPLEPHRSQSKLGAGQARQTASKTGIIP